MKELDELIDKTDVGIIMSDYMGSQWNGNMRDDIVDMVNTKYKALIATQINQARIDEINSMREAMTFEHMTPTIYASKRLKELKSDDD